MAKSSVENRAEKRRIHLDAGSYYARIGFRPFGKFEADWHSGSTDDSDTRDRPFPIDVESPILGSFGERLLAGLPDVNDPRFIANLDVRYSSLLPSAPVSGSENYSRLSDIVREGSGTCAAKTLLLGVLLSRKFPELQLSEIYGQVGIVKDRASYPFGHEWLRAESEELVFLYDSMYSRTATFKKGASGLEPLGNGADTFRNYSVEAYQVAALYNSLGFTSLSENIKLVDSHDRSSKKFFLTPESGLEAQADGAIDFSFGIDDDAEFELVDGHLQTKTLSGAAVYYPVTSLKREND